MKRPHEDNDNNLDRRVRRLESDSKKDGVDIRAVKDTQEEIQSWCTKTAWEKMQTDTASSAKKVETMEKTLQEHVDAPDIANTANKKAFEEEAATFRENNRRWLINVVNKIHEDVHGERRSTYDNTGGSQGGWQLQQVAPWAAWFMAVLVLAVDPKPQVSIRTGDDDSALMEVIYEGKPHTDSDYVGAQLVYWVFASRTPFPEGGKIGISSQSHWTRTFQGPRDMSLRACLRAVRDLLDICAGCNDQQKDPPCKVCRYKGQRPESPRFSPVSPDKLSAGLQPFPKGKK